MSTTIRFTGGAELQKNLDLLTTRLSRSVQRQALVEAAEPIRLTMAQLAPRAPGAPDIADNIVIGDRPTPAAGRGLGRAERRGSSTGSTWSTAPCGSARSRSCGRRSIATSRVALTLKVIMGSLWRALIGRGFGSTRASGGGTGV